MMGAGGQNHRHQLQASAADLLPTRAAIALAEVAAESLVAELDGQGVHVAAAMRPTIALALLVAACPQIPPARLARCLRLDPVEEPERLAAAPRCSVWPAARIAEAALAIGGGQ